MASGERDRFDSEAPTRPEGAIVEGAWKELAQARAVELEQLRSENAALAKGLESARVGLHSQRALIGRLNRRVQDLEQQVAALKQWGHR